MPAATGAAIDSLLVRRALWRSPALALPVVQAAVAAAGGFLAGAAAVALLRRRRRSAMPMPRGRGRRARRFRRRGTAPAGAGQLVQVVGSRSLLVDVHLLEQR